jgi:hypothetical protein
MASSYGSQDKYLTQQGQFGSGAGIHICIYLHINIYIYTIELFFNVIFKLFPKI